MLTQMVLLSYNSLSFFLCNHNSIDYSLSLAVQGRGLGALGHTSICVRRVEYIRSSKGIQKEHLIGGQASVLPGYGRKNAKKCNIYRKSAQILENI